MLYLLLLCVISTVHLITTAEINIALGKPTMEINQEYNRSSEKAVDGNLSGFFRTCTHTMTKLEGRPNWWMVNLEARYRIHRMAIRNRSTFGFRLINFLLTVWEVNPAPLIVDDMPEIYCKCLHHPDRLPTTGLIDLPCTTNCTGQFVAVILPSDFLTLCEVQVYGQLLDYSPRKSLVLNVMPGKRANTSTTDQAMYPIQSMTQCSTYCLNNDHCLGINYVYNETIASTMCEIITSTTNPETDVIDDENSTWLVLRQINFIN